MLEESNQAPHLLTFSNMRSKALLNLSMYLSKRDLTNEQVEVDHAIVGSKPALLLTMTDSSSQTTWQFQLVAGPRATKKTILQSQTSPDSSPHPLPFFVKGILTGTVFGRSWTIKNPWLRLFNAFERKWDSQVAGERGKRVVYTADET